MKPNYLTSVLAHFEVRGKVGGSVAATGNKDDTSYLYLYSCVSANSGIYLSVHGSKYRQALHLKN